YDTGALSLDEKFAENIAGAEAVGMPYGIYFFSQATSDVEAFEEVQFIVAALSGHQVIYPVAIDMEIVSGHSSRLSKVTAVQRTGITNTFLQGIKNAGFVPMIYGNKEWLLTRIDMRSLYDYDIWLSNDGETPDYPYRFSMWQYTTKGSIPGIDGDACLDISFVDYGER
nr:glycoside hydrolase [Lachnospiraceae bacterium]